MRSEPRRRLDANGAYMLDFTEVDSTQDEARTRRMSGEVRLLGVRADYQTRGRGQRGATWYAPRGEALLVTYLVPAETDRPDSSAMLSLAAGLAIARAIERITDLQPALRWPNDVLIEGRKAAGVLIERFIARDEGAEPMDIAAVGIGLNVNTTEWPDELAQTATSIRSGTGRIWSVMEVETAVRTALTETLRFLREASPAQFTERWRRYDQTIGTRYLTSVENQPVIGIATGVADSGSLMLRLENGDDVEATSARHLS